jgi:hypothetical protein
MKKKNLHWAQMMIDIIWALFSVCHGSFALLFGVVACMTAVGLGLQEAVVVVVIKKGEHGSSGRRC